MLIGMNVRFWAKLFDMPPLTQVNKMEELALLRNKFTLTLSGICDLHNFLFVLHPGSDVKLRVCCLCYSGSIHECQFNVKRGYTLAESATPTALWAIGTWGKFTRSQIQTYPPSSDVHIFRLLWCSNRLIPRLHPAFQTGTAWEWGYTRNLVVI